MKAILQGQKNVVATEAFLIKAPIGTIVIWSGAITDIPSGWQLCDGTNGTPDLRNKFVLGAGTRTVGETGGQEEVTLISKNLPPHSHNINVYEEGSTDLGSSYVIPGIKDVANISPIGAGTTDYNSTQATPFNIMPPYYTLCYIMKLTEDITDIEGSGGGVPNGGRAGQVLTKKSDYDKDVEWTDVQAGIPDGGMTGQLLAKRSNSDKDVKWTDPGVGRTLAGNRVKPSFTTMVTAKDGSEIFNDTRDRSYDSTGVANAGNVATGLYAHAEGFITTATNTASHAEGSDTLASGLYAHAEGKNTEASKDYAHAEGKNSVASGLSSHAQNHYTVAAADFQTAMGKYNKESKAEVDKLIIGKGIDGTPSNCFRVTDTGVYASGNYNASGADYAEMFEWADGNPSGEDRVGRFVTLKGDKIKIAGPEDTFILGIISGDPSVVGDVHDDQWYGMYMYDVYNRPLWEVVTIPAEKDKDGSIIPSRVEHRQKISPEYDSTQVYIPRTQRVEWDAVGMMGKLVAIDDGTCEVDGWCAVGENGIATESMKQTKYRVMKRLDRNHIQVLVI